MTNENFGNDLIFGLISPIGTDTNQFQTNLTHILRSYNYSLDPVKVSHFIEGSLKKKGFSIPKNQYERKKLLINEGDLLRLEHGHECLAKFAVASIYANRMKGEKQPKVGGRKVFFINGIKHFKEIEFLRSLYGTSFFLIGLFATEEQRLQNLTNHSGLTKENAFELIKKDQDNENKHGQQLSDTFHRSDVFIPSSSSGVMDKELRRFVDLVFGYPYHTPRIDEHMMFHAFAAALRSADLSRQVGAVISTKDGDILSSGANDVPKYGGGQYWSDDPHDKRDFVQRFDSNKTQRNRLVTDIVKSLMSDKELKQTLKPSASMENKLFNAISKSEIKTISEYGRAVHAEMAAITTAARLGVNTKECILYTTTFPCHNCAKHVIASGIKRVVYVEPYPKSLAFQLHGDAACQGPLEKNEKNILAFEPFIGIGPRRFFDLFSMTLSNGDEIKRNIDGFSVDIEKSTVYPRIKLNMNSIIEQEEYTFDSSIELLQMGNSHDKATKKGTREFRQPPRARKTKTRKSQKN